MVFILYIFCMFYLLYILYMPRVLQIPSRSNELIPTIVAEIQKEEPSCRWPFQPINSDWRWTYSVWPWTENCSRIYYKDSIKRFWDERHIHFVKEIDGKIFAAVWDDLPWLPDTSWYWKLIMSDDKWKTWGKLLQNDRANFTSMRKIWDTYFLWEDAWIKTPTSRVLKTKDFKKFSVALQLPKKYAWNIVWWVLYKWKYWIGTFVDRKWMIPTLWSSKDWIKWVLEREYPKAVKDRHWVYRIQIINGNIDIAYNNK